jgi:hypothetical protein
MASADGRGWRHAGGCGLPVNPQLRTAIALRPTFGCVTINSAAIFLCTRR